MATDNPQAEITITAAAARHLRAMVRRRGKGVCGVRLGVKKAGCSGYEYVMDYVAKAEAGDFVKREDGFLIAVDPGSYEILRGLNIDFQEDALSSAFVFSNPNKKGECGCGASFTV